MICCCAVNGNYRVIDFEGLLMKQSIIQLGKFKSQYWSKSFSSENINISADVLENMHPHDFADLQRGISSITAAKNKVAFSDLFKENEISSFYKKEDIKGEYIFYIELKSKCRVIWKFYKYETEVTFYSPLFNDGEYPYAKIDKNGLYIYWEPKFWKLDSINSVVEATLLLKEENKVNESSFISLIEIQKEMLKDINKNFFAIGISEEKYDPVVCENKNLYEIASFIKMNPGYTYTIFENKKEYDGCLINYTI